MTNISIRRIVAHDIAPLLTIYNHYVTATHISFRRRTAHARTAKQLVRKFFADRTAFNASSPIATVARSAGHPAGILSRIGPPTIHPSKPASISRRAKAGRDWGAACIKRCSMRLRMRTCIVASAASRFPTKLRSASMLRWVSATSAPMAKSAANSASSGTSPGTRSAWAGRPCDGQPVDKPHPSVKCDLKYRRNKTLD